MVIQSFKPVFMDKTSFLKKKIIKISRNDRGMTYATMNTFSKVNINSKANFN